MALLPSQKQSSFVTRKGFERARYEGKLSVAFHWVTTESTHSCATCMRKRNKFGPLNLGNRRFRTVWAWDLQIKDSSRDMVLLHHSTLVSTLQINISFFFFFKKNSQRCIYFHFNYS